VRNFWSGSRYREDEVVGAGVGNGISVGGGAEVGNGISVGGGAEVGNGISVGGGAAVGNGAFVGEGAGEDLAVGEDRTVADGAAGFGRSGDFRNSVSEGIHFWVGLTEVGVKVAGRVFTAFCEAFFVKSVEVRIVEDLGVRETI
jgi:hypothetical protein